MKKLTLFWTFIILFSFIVNYNVNAVNFIPNVEIASDAVYLVNLDTDTVIYQKNAEKTEYPASLTKIMTSILVLENIKDLDNTMIEAPSYIFDELYLSGASTADFLPYEIASAKDLMYGMLLPSACEAASILADYVGNGSVNTFVQMMNDKAAEIGATNTHFTNAHGLFDANQYSCAKDIALITEYAMSLPNFNEIVNTYSYEISPSNKHSEPRIITHTNKMLNNANDYYYPYIKGIKTGTLDESGRSLVSSASKDGYNYLLVVMNSPLTDSEGNDVMLQFIDTKNLYNWAFDNFSEQTLLNKKETIGEVPVEFSDGNEFVIVHPEEDYTTLWDNSVEQSSIQRIITLSENVVAPVKKGQVLGTIDLKLAGESLTTVNLIASDDVERSDFKYNIYITKQFINTAWFKLTILIIALIIILYTFMYFKNINKKRHTYRRKK